MSTRNRVRGLLAVLTLLLVVGAAAACPFCDYGPERVNPVNQALFSGDVGLPLAAVALPFLLTLGIAAAVHFRPPSKGGRS